MVSVKREHPDDGGPCSGSAVARKSSRVESNSNTVSTETMPVTQSSDTPTTRHLGAKQTRQNSTSFWPSYKDIAPKVALSHEKRGDDIPSFRMPNARFPDDTFWDILQDLRATIYQYGLFDYHLNAEAGSRYISGHFNRLLSLFSGALLNTPDTLLERETTKPGWRENRYAVGGAITILVIKVSTKTGYIDEQNDHMALAIARCFAANTTNSEAGFRPKISCILINGDSFQFFEFHEKHPKQPNKSVFSVGKFEDYDRTIIMEIGPSRWSSIEGFYTQGAVEGIRLVCDALYGTLLRAYSRGVDAHIKRSLNVRGGEEIQRWEEAAGKARAAIVKADEASCIYDGGGENKKVRSQESARKALEHLQTSVEKAPIRKHELLPGFTWKMVAES